MLIQPEQRKKRHREAGLVLMLLSDRISEEYKHDNTKCFILLPRNILTNADKTCT